MGTDHTSAKGHAARLTNLQSLAEPRKTPEKPVFELQPFEARLFAGSMMSPLGDPVDPVPSGGFSLAALTKDARHDTPA